MGVLVDKKKIGNNTNRLRLTIQIDLSGFSFLVCKSDGTCLYHYQNDFPSGILHINQIEVLLKREIESHQLLRKDYESVKVYYNTPKYTLVPILFFKPDEALSILSRLHTIDDLDEILFAKSPDGESVLIYAMPNAVTSHIFRFHKNAEFYPMSFSLLHKIITLSDYNRILVHFSDKMIHVVTAEKDKLLLSNSYNTPDFVTAFYYIFLTMKEVMFNPEVTTLYISGSLKFEQFKELEQYFMKVKRCEL